MFVLELARPGDSCNYYPLDVVGKILAYGGKYAHTSTISDINYKTGEVKIIESHFETGVVEKTLNPKWYPTIDVRRIDLTSKELDRFIFALRLRIGSGYGLSDFRPTIRGLLLEKIGINIRQWPAFGNNPKVYYCTELRGNALYNAVGKNCCNGIHHSQLIPSDLGWRRSNERLIS